MTERKKAKKLNPNRIHLPERDADERSKCFDEVNLGYIVEQAKQEAERCLFCKKPLCVPGCPVEIDIPGFISKLAEGDFAAAYAVLKESNPIPAICGRVCPQETQCEATCVVGRRGDAVGIGHLERFVGDWGMQHTSEVKAYYARVSASSEQSEREGEAPAALPVEGATRAPKEAKKAAVIGAGPAGIACAQDLAKAGVEVTIYEALHKPGGVLAYGIPPFRLPRIIVDDEVKKLTELGVKFELNKVIGKLFTIDQLMKEKGCDVVFIGTGAGLPKFMGIPGEHFNGVMSANEFLTRTNLMHGDEGADTPVGMGDYVAVIGAGNTALDGARIALRMGAKEVSIVYRRSEKESPARLEELRHAQEEGIHFQWLTNPVRQIGDKEGNVIAMECVRMELGEPDESGRRSPHPIEGSEFEIKADTVIYALGTSANPIIEQTTPDLKTNRWGYIEVDPETQMTSKPGVFAGGDIVTGAATVILALGAGRKAAKGALQYLGLVEEEAEELKERAHGNAVS